MMMVAMCVKLVMEQQLWAAPLCPSQVGHADSSICVSSLLIPVGMEAWVWWTVIYGGNRPSRSMGRFYTPLPLQVGRFLLVVLCYNTVAIGFMLDNHPSARVKPMGEGVVIDHKSHGYGAVSIIYPTWLVQLVAPLARE